jgi:HPt (histidine-containing phosphotransfer) domain-containing protein
MTAFAMKEDREKSLAAGMNDHATKPIEIDELIYILAGWINPEEDRESPIITEDNTAERIAEIPANLPGIDIQSAMRRLEGNIVLFKKLLLDFGKNHIETSGEITEAISEGNTETALIMVHSIKGVAGNISAVDLQAAAGDFEDAIREGRQGEFPEKLAVFQKAFSLALSAVGALGEENESRVESEETPPGSDSRSTERLSVQALTERLEELAVLLRQSDVEAAACLKSIRRRLDTAGFRKETQLLDNRIGRYDFDEALDALNDIMAVLRADAQGGGNGR